MRGIRPLSARLIRSWIPTRKRNSHKGDYGHVLIVAGSRGMAGAGILCAQGALRGGSGLVTLAVPKSQQTVVAKRGRPESMTLGLPETRSGTIASDAVPILLDRIKKRGITSLAIGPGLSRNPETARVVVKIFKRVVRLRDFQGIVLDADGFLAFKDHKDKAHILQTGPVPLIVTPHPGEMAQFMGVKTAHVQQDRIKLTQKFAKLNQAICVLKGDRTVVSDGQNTFINRTGNPGMATGGSGDVLTGLIAALISQVSKTRLGSNPIASILKAACVGVFIHGLAGDLAKKKKTEIALLAGDIANEIPRAFKRVLG